MQIYYSTLLVFFGIIVYMMIVDKNVSDAINLIFKLFLIRIERLYWMIRFHPKNPITNLLMKWKYDRLALELHKELTGRAIHVNVESENKDQ
jgi:hypothetical protein